MTKTNFFSELEKLNVKQFSITILFENNTTVISILPIAKLNDNATKLKPITISANTNEMDEKFFLTVSENLVETGTFFSNVEQYEKKLKIQQNETAEKKELKEKIKTLQNKLLKIVDDADFDANIKKNEVLKICKNLKEIDSNNKIASTWTEKINTLTNTLF